MKTWLSIVLVILGLCGCIAHADTKCPTCPVCPTCAPTQTCPPTPTLLIREVTRLVTVIVTPTYTPTSTSTPTPTPTATPTPYPDAPQGETVEAQVVSIVDGDTIRVLIDGEEYPLRYIGIDTPETKHPDKPVSPFGQSASDANAALVGGRTVLLERDVSPTDRYDRLLAYVWVDGMMVNEELVRLGWAESKAYPPDTKYQVRLDHAERDARLAGRGIWAQQAGVIGTPTASAMGAHDVILVVHKGNDPAERFEVCNVGEMTLDLSGWRLLSQRGEQWYYFPPDVSLAPDTCVCVYSGLLAKREAERNDGLFWIGEYVWNNSKHDPGYLYDASLILRAEWPDN